MSVAKIGWNVDRSDKVNVGAPTGTNHLMGRLTALTTVATGDIDAVSHTDHQTLMGLLADALTNMTPTEFFGGRNAELILALGATSALGAP